MKTNSENLRLEIIVALIMASLGVLRSDPIDTSEAAQAELPNVTALDPTATNFSPKVVILVGKIQDSRTTTYPITWCGNRFELAIFGSTNYYYKEWRSQADETHDFRSGYKVLIVDGDFAASEGLSGGMGGGGIFSPKSARPGEFPARRLWSDAGFVGANPDDLVFKKWDDAEGFSKLEKFGSYFLPRKIITTETFNPGQVLHKEYTVEKIIFSNEPNVQWLDGIKEKYFADDIRLIDKSQTNATPRSSEVITN